MRSSKMAVENIGSTETAEAELPPGVTVFARPNASNRISFPQAIMAGPGSDVVSLKGDADEGRVELNSGVIDGFSEGYKSLISVSTSRERGTIRHGRCSR